MKPVMRLRPIVVGLVLSAAIGAAGAALLVLVLPVLGLVVQVVGVLTVPLLPVAWLVTAGRGGHTPRRRS